MASSLYDPLWTRKSGVTSFPATGKFVSSEGNVPARWDPTDPNDLTDLTDLRAASCELRGG